MLKANLDKQTESQHTCTKSSMKASGREYSGSWPNRATASQLRSTAHDSMCTRLCRIACRDARLPPLPRGLTLPGATTLTYSCSGNMLIKPIV